MKVSEQSCEWKGSQVCEGAVTLETKNLLQVDNADADNDDAHYDDDDEDHDDDDDPGV